MLQLYFGSALRIASTALTIGSTLLITFLLKNHSTHMHKGLSFAVLFAMGLLMSIFSGTRDRIGTPGGFPTQGALFITLCALGALGFVVALAALLSKFFRTSLVVYYGSYALIAIIIVKTILVEGRRIITHL